jgi:23S rRNA (uracil1939-C5)-methyltransferase
MATLKRGSEIEVDIESLAFGGDGIGRVEGMAVFVPDVLPGQRIRARIQKKKPSFAKARLLSVITPSPDEITPQCQHFVDCGGCSLQNYRYEKQLITKASQVRESLQHIGGFENPPLSPILPSPEQFYYRNKMEYTFGDRRWITQAEVDSGMQAIERDFALGLHVRRRFDKILAIEKCHLQSEISNHIRNFIAQETKNSPLRPYTTRDHSGFWRFLVIREGKNTGQIMVNIVTADGNESGKSEVDLLAEKLGDAFPEITTMVHTLNRQKAQVAIGQETRILSGPGIIFEKIGKWQFRISPESFFQTNTHGAELLFAKAVELAELQGDEVLYDFYCGAGTIGIYLSEKVKKVIGIEIVPEAIADPRKNAQLNGVENCHFLCGDLKDRLEDFNAAKAQHEPPDAILFDPPRAGLHPKVASRSLSFGAKKIVYISCNPATFARDARLFCDGGYELTRVQPVDMFPHTAHIELVSAFRKR